MKRKKGIIYILVITFLCEQKKVNEKSLNYDYEINTKEDDMSIDIDAEE